MSCDTFYSVGYGTQMYTLGDNCKFTLTSCSCMAHHNYLFVIYIYFFYVVA